MKNITIRLLLFITLLVLLVFNPFVNLEASFLTLAIETMLAIGFSIATVYFTGRADFFIPISVFSTTVLLRLLIHFAIGFGSGESWQKVVNSILDNVIIKEPLWTVLLFIPLVASVICSRLNIVSNLNYSK